MATLYFSAQLQWHEIDFHQVDTLTRTHAFAHIHTLWYLACKINAEIDVISQIQFQSSASVNVKYTSVHLKCK